MTKWTQNMHGAVEAHVAKRKCCSLTIIGGPDQWVWTVQCRKSGGAVEADAHTFEAAKAAAEEMAGRLTGDLPLMG